MTATFDESVSSLQAIFPHIAPDVIKNVLLSQHGNMEHAAAVLVTEKPEEKTSMRDLSTFELRKVLLAVDRKMAETFYAHGIDGEGFVALTSENCRKYGFPLNPYKLATLKKQAKIALLENQEAEELNGGAHRWKDDDDSPQIDDSNAPMVHCVTVPTMVRESKSLQSEPIGGLSPGTAVKVEEISGLRVRISEPLEGWISSQAQNGIRILLKMKQEDLDHLLAQELQNPHIYQSNLDEEEQWYREQDYMPRNCSNGRKKRKGSFFKSIKNLFKSNSTPSYDFKGD